MEWEPGEPQRVGVCFCEFVDEGVSYPGHSLTLGIHSLLLTARSSTQAERGLIRGTVVN